MPARPRAGRSVSVEPSGQPSPRCPAVRAWDAPVHPPRLPAWLPRAALQETSHGSGGPARSIRSGPRLFLPTDLTGRIGTKVLLRLIVSVSRQRPARPALVTAA